MKLKRNQLHIVVSGQVCTGKSSIAYFIKDALKERGLSVTVQDVDGSDERRVITTLDDRLKALKEKDTEVIIDVKQTNRKGEVK